MVTVHSKFHLTKTFDNWIEACKYYDSIRYTNGQRNAWMEIPVWHKIVINAHFKAMYDSGFPNWERKFSVGKRYGVASQIRNRWNSIFEFYGL